jgi:MFS family permease
VNEFRRGWPLLLGAFIGIGTGVSSLYFYSLGVFLKPEALDLGWTRGEASLGALAGTLGAAIASAPTGRLMDRIGAVNTAIASMLILALSLAALGLFTHSLGVFVAIAAFLSFMTVGSTPLSYTRLIVGAFDTHRGLALGLALTGTGVGAFVLPVVLGPFIAAHGWRAGYFALAGVVLVATGPVALLLKGRDVGFRTLLQPTPWRAIVSRPDFQRLGLLFFLAATGVLGAVVHFPALLSDARLAPAQIGWVAGLIGVAVIAGRAVAGMLLDRTPARFVIAGFFCISAGGLLAVALGGGRWAVPGALALGLSVGAEVDLIAYLVSRRFPAQAYGAAYGGIYGLFLFGGALGPALLGALFDRTGGYGVPFTVAAACLLCAAVLALGIAPAQAEPGQWRRASGAPSQPDPSATEITGTSHP